MLRPGGRVHDGLGRFALGLALSAVLTAQGQGGAARPAHRQSAAAAIEKWLASEHDSADLMAATVATVCDAEDGLVVLGALQDRLVDASSGPRSKGLRSLFVKVALEHLRRTHKSDMTFVGQYRGLRPLQPWLDPFLFGLLLDTPEWYPLTFRVRLVPAIRDLSPKLPSADRVEAILALVDDEREPVALRRGLAALLWRWGKKSSAQRFVRELRMATAEGDGEDRVHATLQLADYFNTLQDYRSAASAHRAAQALARGAGVELLPVAYYSAACVHALLGDKERGIEALQRCAEMHASPNLDSSRRLKRELFEEDPEIALLRTDDRFAGLLKLAFGGRSDDDEAGGR